MTREVTILLVEDDKVDAEGVMRAIRRQKIANNIVHTCNGLEALEALAEDERVPRPRITLLDLNMPRMNGIDFLKHIRQDSRLKQEIVFVLTTSLLEQDRIASYDLNVAGYILKDNAGEDFQNLLNFLDKYWRIVEFPV